MVRPFMHPNGIERTTYLASNHEFVQPRHPSNTFHSGRFEHCTILDILMGKDYIRD
jgi:hypothetical protein